MARILAAILLAAALSGCASTANYEKILDSWVGNEVDDLVTAWGPPARSHTFADGRRVYTYVNANSAFVPGNVSTDYYGNVCQQPGFMVDLYCETTFYISPEGWVTNWKWRGNKCRA